MTNSAAEKPTRILVEALLKVRYLNRDPDRALASLHERALNWNSQTLRERVPPAGTGAGAILEVDDEPLTRRVYSDGLQEAGYTCYTAESGAQALEATRQQAVDIVLLDIMMPARSGLEVLADLGERIPESPVIIVTAHPASDNAIAALRLGAFDFIVKGFKRGDAGDGCPRPGASALGRTEPPDDTSARSQDPGSAGPCSRVCPRVRRFRPPSPQGMKREVGHFEIRVSKLIRAQRPGLAKPTTT